MIIILYTIRFNTGMHEGKTLNLEIPLDEIEIDDLVGYLVDNNYLDCYVNNNEFNILNRAVL